MPQVDYEGHWYSGDWSVFTQTACDDPTLNGWWWSWVGLEIWEDDDIDDDAVDWHFITTSGGYQLSFGILSYPQEFIGDGRGDAKIVIESEYN